MKRDRFGWEVLDRDECLRLLASVPVGRVGVSIDALPVILPVYFALDGQRIVFSTNAGTKLNAAVGGAVVCFEVDYYDVSTMSGWSVLVTGRAQPEPADSYERLNSLGVGGPRAAARSRWVSVDCELVSGRRTPTDVLDLVDI